MLTFPFIKCHGSENDFVMIDEVSTRLTFSEEERRAVALALCDRKGPVGADGILYFVPSEKGDGMMRMFNPDGSEAEMCGNGIRCIGRLTHEVLGKDEFYIETLKGLYLMRKEAPIAPNVATFSVDINTVYLTPETLPLLVEAPQLLAEKLPSLSEKRTFTAISLTNPHLIAMVEAVDLEELEAVGVACNTQRGLLPKGVNLTFCQPLGRNAIYTGTYERGAGITFACGTGMSASTIAAYLNGHVPLGEWISVYNQGGLVKCQVNKNAAGNLSVKLLGNATYVYKAKASLSGNVLQITEKHSFPEEALAYEQMKQKAVGEVGRKM